MGKVRSRDSNEPREIASNETWPITSNGTQERSAFETKNKHAHAVVQATVSSLLLKVRQRVKHMERMKREALQSGRLATRLVLQRVLKGIERIERKKQHRKKKVVRRCVKKLLNTVYKAIERRNAMATTGEASTRKRGSENGKAVQQPGPSSKRIETKWSMSSNNLNIGKEDERKIEAEESSGTTSIACTWNSGTGKGERPNCSSKSERRASESDKRLALRCSGDGKKGKGDGKAGRGVRIANDKDTSNNDTTIITTKLAQQQQPTTSSTTASNSADATRMSRTWSTNTGELSGQEESFSEVQSHFSLSGSEGIGESATATFLPPPPRRPQLVLGAKPQHIALSSSDTSPGVRRSSYAPFLKHEAAPPAPAPISLVSSPSASSNATAAHLSTSYSRSRQHQHQHQHQHGREQRSSQRLSHAEISRQFGWGAWGRVMSHSEVARRFGSARGLGRVVWPDAAPEELNGRERGQRNGAHVPGSNNSRGSVRAAAGAGGKGGISSFNVPDAHFLEAQQPVLGKRVTHAQISQLYGSNSSTYHSVKHTIYDMRRHHDRNQSNGIGRRRQYQQQHNYHHHLNDHQHQHQRQVHSFQNLFVFSSANNDNSKKNNCINNATGSQMCRNSGFGKYTGDVGVPHGNGGESGSRELRDWGAHATLQRFDPSLKPRLHHVERYLQQQQAHRRSQLAAVMVAGNGGRGGGGSGDTSSSSKETELHQHRQQQAASSTLMSAIAYKSPASACKNMSSSLSGNPVPSSTGARAAAAAAAARSNVCSKTTNGNTNEKDNNDRETANSSCRYLLLPTRLERSVQAMMRGYCEVVNVHSKPAPTLVKVLGSDITQMQKFLTLLTQDHYPRQMMAINAIRKLVTETWPTARAEVYGSFATELCIPSSDIDLVICDLKPHYDSTSRHQRPQWPVYSRLAEALRPQPWVKSVKNIRATVMPVLKITAQIAGTHIPIDITFDSPSHRGLATRAFVRGLCSEYKQLAPLTLILKQFLVTRGLNDPYRGGLSSYGLVLMIVCVLQRDRLLQKYIAALQAGPGFDAFASTVHPAMRQLLSGDIFGRDHDLGRLLIFFLDTFSWRFDPQVHGVAVPITDQDLDFEFGGGHYRAAFPDHPLVLVDPLDPSNNIGRTCFAIGSLQLAFRQALKSIQEQLKVIAAENKRLPNVSERAARGKQASLREIAFRNMERKMKIDGDGGAPAPPPHECAADTTEEGKGGKQEEKSGRKEDTAAFSGSLLHTIFESMPHHSVVDYARQFFGNSNNNGGNFKGNKGSNTQEQFWLQYQEIVNRIISGRILQLQNEISEMKSMQARLTARGRSMAAETVVKTTDPAAAATSAPTTANKKANSDANGAPTTNSPALRSTTAASSLNAATTTSKAATSPPPPTNSCPTPSTTQESASVCLSQPQTCLERPEEPRSLPYPQEKGQAPEATSIARELKERSSAWVRASERKQPSNSQYHQRNQDGKSDYKEDGVSLKLSSSYSYAIDNIVAGKPWVELATEVLGQGAMCMKKSEKKHKWNWRVLHNPSEGEGSMPTGEKPFVSDLAQGVFLEQKDKRERPLEPKTSVQACTSPPKLRGPGRPEATISASATATADMKSRITISHTISQRRSGSNGPKSPSKGKLEGQRRKNEKVHEKYVPTATGEMCELFFSNQWIPAVITCVNPLFCEVRFRLHGYLQHKKIHVQKQSKILRKVPKYVVQHSCSHDDDLGGFRVTFS